MLGEGKLTVPYDENYDSQTQKPAIADVIAAIQVREENQVPATAYYGLSDATPEIIATFKPFWEQLAPEYRAKLLSALADASETDFNFDYRELGYLGLEDLDSDVRIAAINLLWADESLTYLTTLIRFAENDENAQVRAAAISEVGRFILLGEYEEIPAVDASQAQDVAINILSDSSEHVEVRRRALEAISNSSHEIVSDAIDDAYNSDDRLMRISAIFAMGRSYDGRWKETILRELRNGDAEIRFEAARAAGELEVEEAIPLLGQLATEDDREVQQVSIWSLGEIGGKYALRILSSLAEDAEESDDKDLLEDIEDAIGYANMVGSDLELDITDEDY